MHLKISELPESRYFQTSKLLQFIFSSNICFALQLLSLRISSPAAQHHRRELAEIPPGHCEPSGSP